MLDPAAWLCFNSGNKTHPIGLKRANSFGLLDMGGNAFELTSDRFPDLGYGDSPRRNPEALGPGVAIAVRGGSALAWSALARSAAHLAVSTESTGPGFGLRLVRRAD